MSWSEIKKAINSDLAKPLNVLISEILDNSDTGLPVLKTLLVDAAKENSVDEIEGLLKNDSYGLSAILNMLSNVKPQFQINGFDERLVGEFTQVSTLPYDFYRGSAVVYNNEIHILAGYNNKTSHYKWDGSSWVSVSTLPYSFWLGSAVVYNNEIHILGGGESSTKHYKWNGSSWVKVSTLPYDFYEGSAVVYNNEIHILGSSNGSYYTNHYKWNGSSWESVSTLPYNFYNGSTVVYNNELHILGSENSGNYKYHYKWNGSSWVKVSTLPYDFYYGSAVVYNNEIHLLGGDGNNTAHYTYTLAYICTSYLPSGVKIYHCGVPSDSITTIENCTKQSDGSLLVNSDGVVKFKTIGNNANHYSIY